MVRFVLSPEGVVTPDLRRRLPGRGAWISAHRTSVAEAVKRRVFARAFKTDVEIPDDLSLLVGSLMRKAALQRLALAHKAGLVTFGFDKVSGVLSGSPVLGLVLASDAAAHSRTKLSALAKKAPRLHNRRELADVFASRELGGTLGRERVVHVALSPGQTSDLFFMDALRLRGYEYGPGGGVGDREHDGEPAFAGPLTV